MRLNRNKEEKVVIKESGLLTRDALLTKQELKIEKVDLDDGIFVYVREMTGHERDIWERSIYEIDKNNKPINRLEDFRAKLAVCTICDEEGELLLTPKDVLQLSKSIGASRLEKIIDKAQDLNKVSQKDKEDLTKNSDADLVGNSSSDSVND